MLALAYLAVVIAAGDALAGRRFRYVSWSHRMATAILVGLPIGAFASYLVALALQDLDDPLLPANAIVAVALLGLTVWLRRRRPAAPQPGLGTTSLWDGLTIVVITAVSVWLTFSTYSFNNDALGIATGIWSDFGPTSAIAQSFAVGHNFPTEYPHFAHESIRYHFMFYFLVGNVTHLGLNPALANNLLSVATVVAMLVVVMALGKRLFGSAAVGRIAALLFFLHGSLSFIPLVTRFGSPGEAVDRLWNMTAFVASGFPYRGEEWGIWTQIVFLNQRHLASAIGLILVIVYFLLDRRGRSPAAGSRSAPADMSLVAAPADTSVVPDHRSVLALPARLRAAIGSGIRDPLLPGYMFVGFLAGLLPLWNGAIYVAAAAVLATWLILFPKRIQMLVLGTVAAVVSLPQILFIQRGNLGDQSTFPSLHWGYTIEPAGISDVVVYLGFIFGPKLVLATVALIRATWRQIGVFLSFTSLVAVAFLVQLSVEVFANHKFLNAWLIVLNLFAAAGIVALWRLRGVLGIPARLVAVCIVAVIAIGGLIDLMPIKNQGTIPIALNGDRLYEWVRHETDPDDVFLTDLYVAHTILLAGRSIYFGWPYYAWSAGYDVASREVEYRDLLSMRNPRELVRRLQQNDIAYVAIDDGLRSQRMIADLNEDILRAHLGVAFDDAEGRYANLIVFRVPDDPTAWRELPGAAPVDAFTGGPGHGPGLFDTPRGIGLASDGTIAVADGRNQRIQIFEPNGAFRAEVSLTAVDGANEAGSEPWGVDIDAAGHIWVVDALNHLLVELDQDGTQISTWGGPEPGFYGPRDVVIGSEGDVFVLDQGRARVVRRMADGTVITYGSFGTGDGQINDPTGMAVDGERLYVADTTNQRVVVFDLSGQFVSSWNVEAWAAPHVWPDLAVSSAGNRVIYASSPATGEVLVFAPDGTLLGVQVATGPAELLRPGSLVVADDGSLLVLDELGNRVVRIQPGD